MKTFRYPMCFLAGYLSSSIMTRIDHQDYGTLQFPAVLLVVVVLALIVSGTRD